MFPSPCTSMKSSDSRQPGKCSALLPSSALFLQPFLAAQQSLAQCLFPVPSSSWRKMRGKGLASLCGFILKSPSVARAAADHQNPISPPWHTGPCSTRSCSEALGWGPTLGHLWPFPYRVTHWLQSQGQSRDAPLPYTLPTQLPSVTSPSLCISEESRSTSSSAIRPHPGTGHSSFPVPWDMQPSGTRQHSCDTRKRSK